MAKKGKNRGSKREKEAKLRINNKNREIQSLLQ